MPHANNLHPAFWIARNGATYEIRSRFGVEMDGIETQGSAEGHLEAFLDAAADEDDASAPRAAIADFLHALDRGDFGDLRIGPSYDRAESAFITALRLQVSAPAASQKAA